MMKKILSLFMIITMFLINLNTTIISAENENYDSKYIKVGIGRRVPDKNNVKLKGNGFTIVVDNGNISELFKITSEDMVAKTKNFSYHIELSESFNSYTDAVTKASSLNLLGISSYVAYQQGFKVWIGEFTSEVSAEQYLVENPGLNSETVSISENGPVTYIENSNNQRIISFDNDQNIYIKSTGEVTQIEEISYRGYVGFINNKNNLTTINYIQIGDYLKGVVPREMSASWELEALKAQAVSARNYALKNLDKHKSLGYDLCDSTNCQVYDGYSIEHSNTNRAISETRDKVLRYNGEIAQTFYYSCSGGYTVNNEDAWNGTPIPYLRGKRDPYSDNTPQSNWTYTISKSEAANKLKAKGYDVGQILSLETIKDSLGARVLELRVVGTNGTKSVPKEKIIEVFGYSNIKSTNYTIDYNFDITVPIHPPVEPVEPVEPLEPVEKNVYIFSSEKNTSKKVSLDGLSVMSSEGIKKLDPKLQNIVVSNGVEKIELETKMLQEQKPSIVEFASLASVSGIPRNGDESITFNGSGWGHGVGMSQYGALNMAKQGHNFREILEFYFTGTRVE